MTDQPAEQVNIDIGFNTGHDENGNIVVYVKQAIYCTPASARQLAAQLLNEADTIDPPAPLSRAERRRAKRVSANA
jgi:hypothetical protein